MKHFIKKIMPLLFITGIGIEFTTHAMQEEDTDLALQDFPNELKGIISSLVLESSFGANFEPLITIPTAQRLTAATVSPDRKTVLIASVDGIARLWDLATKTQVQEFIGHKGRISSVAFSPKGNFILTGSQDKSAGLWDITTGNQVHEFMTGSPVKSVAWSPDGESILTGSDETHVQLWDSSTGNLLHDFIHTPGNLNQALTVAFSPDGKTIAAGFFNGQILLWDKDTGNQIQEMESPKTIQELVFSKDGTSLLTRSLDTTADLWDTTTGTVLQQFTNPDSRDFRIISLAFSPGDTFVLTGAANGIISVWEKTTGKKIREFKRLPDAVLRIAPSSDDESMITVSIDGTIILWSVSAVAGGMTDATKQAAKDLYVSKLYQVLGAKRTS